MDRWIVVPVDRQLGERGVLLEPASVVAKARNRIERIGRRALGARSVLVTTMVSDSRSWKSASMARWEARTRFALLVPCDGSHAFA